MADYICNTSPHCRGCLPHIICTVYPVTYRTGRGFCYLVFHFRNRTDPTPPREIPDCEGGLAVPLAWATASGVPPNVPTNSHSDR